MWWYEQRKNRNFISNVIYIFLNEFLEIFFLFWQNQEMNVIRHHWTIFVNWWRDNRCVVHHEKTSWTRAKENRNQMMINEIFAWFFFNDRSFETSSKKKNLNWKCICCLITEINIDSSKQILRFIACVSRLRNCFQNLSWFVV